MIKSFDGTTIILIISVGLTVISLLLGVAKLAQFYTNVDKLRHEADSNLTGIANQLGKMQTMIAEMLKEQRRTSRLIADLTDLKKAEMTGEFEIIETPINDTVENIQQDA